MRTPTTGARHVPLAWIVLGLIAGFIGSKIVNNTGQGLLVDILLGVVGAVVGGFLFNQFGDPGVSGSTSTACSSPSSAP